MKRLILILALYSSAAIAAEVTETTTSTSTTVGDGTIGGYSPGRTLIVKEKNGPVTYRYGKSVTYVTRGGKTLTDEDVKTRVKVGVPVKVHYGMEGQDRVISRLEVEED
jgi:hypothetical protein